MKSCCLPSHGVQLVSPTAFKTWIRGNHCWVIEYATVVVLYSHVISAWSLSNLSFKGSVHDYNAHFIFHKLNKKGKCPPIRKSLFNSPSCWSQDGSPTYKMKSWRNSLSWWIFQTLTPSLRVHHPERFWSQESRLFYKVTPAGWEFRACQKLFSLQHSLPLWCEEYNLCRIPG